MNCIWNLHAYFVNGGGGSGEESGRAVLCVPAMPLGDIYGKHLHELRLLSAVLMHLHMVSHGRAACHPGVCLHAPQMSLRFEALQWVQHTACR